MLTESISSCFAWTQKKIQPTCIQTVHIGSLNASIVHPREVLKPAILSNAASILIAHNHPSNDVEPSPEDIEVTKRLIQAVEIQSVEVLDHIILGHNQFLSQKIRGTSNNPRNTHKACITAINRRKSKVLIKTEGRQSEKVLEPFTALHPKYVCDRMKSF